MFILSKLPFLGILRLPNFDKKPNVLKNEIRVEILEPNLDWLEVFFFFALKWHYYYLL